MNTIIVVALALLVMVVIYMLVKKMMSSDSDVNRKDQMKKNFKRHLIEVHLPDVVKDLKTKDLRNLAAELLKTYKVLEYEKKVLNDMDDFEWHSWQVSTIIKMYKEEMDLFIPNYKEIFPSELADLSAYSLEQKLHPIFDKYNKEVSKKMSQKYLLDQVIWTSKDMSILLLFLAKYKQ
ncbi:MAG: hypothetical protein U9N30_11050 [Campylobacterota bacterium]|nr:hypothetical protein [Campylobacterota bacterium]